MAARWQHLSDRIALESFHSTLSRLSWRYVPKSPAQTAACPDECRQPLVAKIQDSLRSRALWRTLLVITAMLVLSHLFVNNLRHKQSALGDTRGRFVFGVHVPAPKQDIEWSQYAYCQYATTTEYLCNSMMIFESLQRLGSQASRVIMYPKEWAENSETKEGRMLLKVRDKFGVVLKAVEVQHFDGNETWADSFTKLLAFNQTDYTRVLSLDSDATVLQSMDELFLMPSAPVAMPRAYWLEDEPTLSSQLVLVEPSTFEMNRVLEAFRHRSPSDYDMEIVNDLYGKDCIIIPHRRYDLLTGEFRNQDHHLYLGSKEEVWDPEAAYNEAKFLHFSDWPLPKPWIHASLEEIEKVVPHCHRMTNGTEDCRDREKWLFVYQDFRERRERVCGTEFVSFQDATLATRATEESPWYQPIFGSTKRRQ